MLPGCVRCTTLREHSPPFEFIWHGASVRSGPVHDRPRSGGIFGQFDGETLRSRSSVRLFLDTSCVLFAYFVLRTRRARPSHFRHVCLLGTEYRRGCRCNPVRISGGIAKKSRRNVAFALCFPRCSLHVHWLIYDFVFAPEC